MPSRPSTSQGATTTKLKSLTVLASYRIGDFPRAGLKFHPWSTTDTKALLLNAYDLLANPRTFKFTNVIRERGCSLGKYVNFRGPVMLDSGAFNFIKHTEISIKAPDVLDVAIELGANSCVVLDHPFPQHASKEEISVRLKRTRTNTGLMLDRLQKAKNVPTGFQLIPVLHGHDEKTLLTSLRDIRSVFGHDPNAVGIGSLAPLAQNGSKRVVVDIVHTVRQLLPEAKIHCFSMGSALLMLLAFYSGADSVDSQTWIMSAAFKQVQLPGFYLTTLSRREIELNPNSKLVRSRFARHLLRLSKEEGFVVKNWDTRMPWPIVSISDARRYMDFLMDQPGVNNIHRRACHNLYAFNFEAKRLGNLINGPTLQLERFIIDRLRNTNYKRVFEYALQLRSKV